MEVTDIILQLAEKNNEIVTTSVINVTGIPGGSLNYLVGMGKLERTSRGVYILPEVWEDKFINLQSRFKWEIFSHETALSLYDLTGKTPNHYDMTLPFHYDLTSAKEENVRCTQTTELLFGIGIELVYTPNGNIVHAYNPKRALCDILGPRSHVDIQIVVEVFKSYIKQKNKNIPHLPEYARLFKVKERLRHYLEALLRKM